mmetsp:Transcript_12278/g.40331  ORF Transcript_12278/g.40331 Transcript_12278/m.40331 type:complete len:295 (-) Transcript_12278:80-964(-)|eukprot:scaffold14925_cov97-Isochrysis_galbana.AAC.7
MSCSHITVKSPTGTFSRLGEPAAAHSESSPGSTSGSDLRDRGGDSGTDRSEGGVFLKFTVRASEGDTGIAGREGGRDGEDETKRCADSESIISATRALAGDGVAGEPAMSGGFRGRTPATADGGGLRRSGIMGAEGADTLCCGGSVVLAQARFDCGGFDVWIRGGAAADTTTLFRLLLGDRAGSFASPARGGGYGTLKRMCRAGEGLEGVSEAWVGLVRHDGVGRDPPVKASAAAGARTLSGVCGRELSSAWPLVVELTEALCEPPADACLEMGDPRELSRLAISVKIRLVLSS